jgi:hypothetical protein
MRLYRTYTYILRALLIGLKRWVVEGKAPPMLHELSQLPPCMDKVAARRIVGTVARGA